MHPCILNGGLAASLMLFASGFATGANVSSGGFLPSIAVSHDRTTAFTSVMDGRLVAINLADGRVGWESHRPLEALGFANASVIASATVPNCAYCLQVVWLSAADGNEQRASRTIRFPDWVSVERVAGMQFSTTVEAGAGLLLLHWSARSWYVGGARPTSQILADFKKDAAGTFMIDRQGNVTAMTTRSHPTLAIPEALRKVRTTTSWNCSEWSDVPVLYPDGMVAFDVSSRADGQALSARRWRLPSGDLATTRTLAHGSNLELQTSPDSRYLFVHDSALQTDANASTSWRVYSLSTLRQVANIPYPASQVCANVAADIVVMLLEKNPQPNRGGGQMRELVAYATSNGALRWSVTLRGYPQQAPPR